MASLPHSGVYVRIKRSRIHGVGVYAIRDIPKGTYVFRGDENEMEWVKISSTKHLNQEIRKLYQDFCVSRDGMYGCPRSFNLLTPAWYLNHSKKPNMAADDNYDFYSARRIRKGEELTVDYDTYDPMTTRTKTP
jgi:SET domain-containing protein